MPTNAPTKNNTQLIQVGGWREFRWWPQQMMTCENSRVESFELKGEFQLKNSGILPRKKWAFDSKIFDDWVERKCMNGFD